MADAVIVEGLGKRFDRRGPDRPTSFKEAFVTGRLRTPAQPFWGLRDISFSVPAGRTVGIVGKNGAGKSTLLRLIGEVYRPDEGRVSVHGRIGALLDLGAGLSDELTGRENIFLAGVVAGMTRAEVRSRFEEIVTFAELDDVIDDPIRRYSSGMRMRLAFAVAAHIDPAILLIDEVLAVGDAQFQRKCLERIGQFKKKGCTVLIVSHDASQVCALCDEAILLRQGRMLAHGPTSGVMDKYEALVEGRTETLSRAEFPDVALPSGRRLVLGVNRSGNQQVQIKAVRLLNRGGVSTNCILSGDGLTVELTYVAKQPAISPLASVTVHLPDGMAVYDTNTSVAGLELNTLSGEGVIRLHVERLDLAGGDYFVNVGLYGQDWDFTYDHHAQAYPLEVLGPRTAKGVMAPPCRWEATTAQSAKGAATAAPG